MTFVITHRCCNDASCVAVCPVQCIHPRPGSSDFHSTEQLYIDPATCIDCAACIDVCPVEAIYSEWDLPEELSEYPSINAEYFLTNPLIGTAPPTLTRRVLPRRRPQLDVAVVGSGPAGCYAVAALSEIEGVSITLIERLPTPFGLIRAGVAPDHVSTKHISDRFAATLDRGNVRCFFNVEVNRDVTIDELLQYHHAVIWAAGASDDRRLGIPGEDLPGCHSAREFVGWYNGHPEHARHKFDLSGEQVVVIGNGNVALDVARTLLRPGQIFRATDMADYAIEAFESSNVTRVVVTARRGPEHAAYTLGELMALDATPGLTLVASQEEVPGHPAADRRYDIVRRAAEGPAPTDEPTLQFRFGLEPVSIDGKERVETVTFRNSRGGIERVPATLVLRAIGYRGTPVAGLPFDHVTATLPNEAGKVIDPATDEDVLGVYCSGWIKRGPRGIIGTNKQDAEETIDCLLHDFSAERLPDPPQPASALAALIGQRCPDFVDKAAWRRIDLEERRRGQLDSRPRKKFFRVEDLLDAARARR